MITGSDVYGLKPEILMILNFLENVYQTVNLNSGFRSYSYNQKIKGAPNSAHLTGEAIDISIKNVSIIKITATLMNDLLWKQVKGCGLDIYKNYVHLDIKNRGVKDVIYWTYGKNAQSE